MANNKFVVIFNKDKNTIVYGIFNNYREACNWMKKDVKSICNTYTFIEEDISSYLDYVKINNYGEWKVSSISEEVIDLTSKNSIPKCTHCDSFHLVPLKDHYLCIDCNKEINIKMI